MTDQGFVHLSDNGAWRDLAGRFRAAPQQIKALIRQDVTALTVAVRDAVVSEMPSRTGLMRQSVRAVYGQIDGDAVTARVVIGNPKAIYVLQGTHAHIIRPRFARALAFQTPGGMRFARYVRHPGTRPNPFIDRALGSLGLAPRLVKTADGIIALLRVKS